jgi:hypothetical protein
MEIDLHGYHPTDLDRAAHKEALLANIARQAWEMGETELTIIHGHGQNRVLSPGFVNTNTGYFGLRIRDEFRHHKELRKWVAYTTLDCSHNGSTSVKLKRNPAPTRNKLEPLPAPAIDRRPFWMR